MKKILKYTLFAVLTFLGISVIFYGYANHRLKKRMEKKYTVQIKPLGILDSADLISGSRLAIVKGCVDCHGPNLEGRIFIDDPGLGRIVAPNLTRGEGGVGGKFTELDWIRAIRHGLNAENKPLKIMPSQELNHLTETDLADIIAFVMSVPAVDNQLPESKLGPAGVVLSHLDILPLLPAELVDHSREPVRFIANTISLEKGENIAVGCIGCHGHALKGGPAIIPGSPPPSDITKSGNLGKWTEEQFIQTLKTGKTPEGNALQNEFMPWMLFKEHSEIEMKALYMYLQSI